MFLLTYLHTIHYWAFSSWCVCSVCSGVDWYTYSVCCECISYCFNIVQL